MTPLTAIVGAGIAGLTAAHELRRAGHRAVIFDKGRSPGGRTSTRRTSHGGFDHGAQYFTARSKPFRVATKAWQAVGVVTEWSPRIVDDDGALLPSKTRFVPQFSMNGLAKHLAAGLDIRSGTPIVSARYESKGWTLSAATGEEFRAAALIIAVPAPQARALVPDLGGALAAALTSVEFAPCWALLATAEHKSDPGFDCALLSRGPLSWVSRLGAKPGRAANGWVLHGAPVWSTECLEVAPAQATRSLLAEFTRRFGIDLAPTAAHRWRYARVTRPAGDEPSLVDDKRGLVLCGDWCTGSRIEDAYLSGAAAARTILSGVHT